ncbi:glycine betaine/L-proline ABC transporter substrate-binding protein ProX [Acidobacteria bacterium AH-259-G07]|nr:glycine betaine/L-proline ABC transporter substrate-binding protein ProX [Acidobacteria bacterium AH-259-G07]
MQSQRPTQCRLILAVLATFLILVATCSQEQPTTNPEAAGNRARAPIRAPGEGTITRPARGDWDTGWFHAEIFRQLLQELGYTVEEARTLGDPAFFEAVSRGEVDFWANGWFPNSDKELQEVQDAVAVVGYVVKAGALQGYLIDKNTAQKYDITNLKDFRRPEIAKLFDTDGDGKADLTGCNPDWTCADVIEHHLSAYGLRDTVHQVQGEYSHLVNQAMARYKQAKAIFFYTWTPNWTVGELLPGEDVVWLEVPFPSLPDEQKDEEELTTVSGVKGCVDDPCDLGWPPNDIRVVANKRFLEENPAAERLFELVEIPLVDISTQNARMFQGEKSEKDIRRHAGEWIEKHQTLVDNWLREAGEAAL